MVFESEVNEGILKMNALGSIFGFTIEDSDVIMARVIDKLITERRIVGIVIAETREYEYDSNETEMLMEIADAITEIVREKKLLSIKNIIGPCRRFLPTWYGWLRDLVTLQMRGDPVGAYLNLTREIRHLRSKILRSDEYTECTSFFLESTLLPIQDILEETQLIKKVKPLITGYHIGDRTLYRQIFKPTIRPNFMYTKYMAETPLGETVARYKVGDTDIEIFRIPGKVRYRYHALPPEFRLSEEEYTILDAARRVLEERRPKELEIQEQEKMRELFHTLSEDLLRDLSEEARVSFREDQLEKLARILTRYTAGLGIIEILLADENVQDVFVNSPMGNLPIYVNHQQFEECETNLVPTRLDGDRWATRFKLLSGRPLDEANPVLDTELILPGGVARVAAINPRLSPDGLGFALRRHRFRPWTFPLFLREKFMNPLFAGLMWFITSYGRTILVAGTRGSGKTSLLGSIMLQMLPYYRIITSEDSVTGDCQILYKRNGKMEKNRVGYLIDNLIERHGSKIGISGHEILDKNPEKIKVYSLDYDGKVVLADVSSFIRHKVEKEVFEIRTRTGREIKVTGDHSLFTLGEGGSIELVKANEIKKGRYLVTPRVLHANNKPLKEIDVLDSLDNGFVIGNKIKEILTSHWKQMIEIATELEYSKQIVSHWKRKGLIPVKIFKRLLAKGINIEREDLFFKISNNSKPLPAKISLDSDLLILMGLWLADGCYDKDSVIISVVDEYTRSIVYRLAQKFNLNVNMHSDGFSLMLNSQNFQFLMQKILKLGGDAYTKEIPNWIFDLSREQIASLLKGIYSGDGYKAEAEVGLSLTSKNLINDVQTLLLYFGIISRINRMNKRDKTYSCRISSIKSLKPFLENIGFLQEDRMQWLREFCNRKSTHDVTDVIPFSKEFKEHLVTLIPKFNKHDYVKRNNNIGRGKLSQIVNRFDGGNEIIEKLNILANSDIFWDEVADIKSYKISDYVYDFSVPVFENFVCENIVAHNTLELPVEYLRKLGYNIERLKSRSVITKVELELPAEEVIRTALRLGDSSLFIGEIRSVEAKALYEAMRIGALANVVAGTIHGESAYGVFDRVVNDLGVPPTSFKATDLVVIANKLRTQDGLKTFRRVTDLTEVRKHWKKDPADEGGFVNLMEYSATEDLLKPTDTLLAGESYVLNEIAKRVPGWAGRWDLVWDNILLRTKILESVVDIAKKANNPDLLEAETIVSVNENFHSISDRIRREVGEVDSKRVYNEWIEWFKEYAKALAKAV